MDDRSEDIFDLDSGPVLPTRHPQPVTRFFDQDQMDLLAQLDAKIPRLDSQAYYEGQVQDFQAKLKKADTQLPFMLAMQSKSAPGNRALGAFRFEGDEVRANPFLFKPAIPSNCMSGFRKTNRSGFLPICRRVSTIRNLRFQSGWRKR